MSRIEMKQLILRKMSHLSTLQYITGTYNSGNQEGFCVHIFIVNMVCSLHIISNLRVPGWPQYVPEIIRGKGIDHTWFPERFWPGLYCNIKLMIHNQACEYDNHRRLAEQHKRYGGRCKPRRQVSVTFYR